MTNPFAAFANQAAQQPAFQTPPHAPQFPAPTPAQAPQVDAQAAPQQAPQPVTGGAFGDMFATDTSAGDMHRIKDDMGCAVVVRPKDFDPTVKTVNGITAAVTADWIVLDGPEAGAVRLNSYIFNSVVRNTLKNVLDGPHPFFVGVVAEGNAKPGKNAPLIFAPASDEQLKLAEQAVRANNWI